VVCVMMVGFMCGDGGWWKCMVWMDGVNGWCGWMVWMDGWMVWMDGWCGWCGWQSMKGHRDGDFCNAILYCTYQM